jgi:hypothetical protein
MAEKYDKTRPWRPTLREVLIPFIGTREHALREVDYFRGKNWLILSPSESEERERTDKDYANSEQRKTELRFGNVAWLLVIRDFATIYGSTIGGLNLLSKF